MARILLLGKSGSGKSTSLGHVPQLKIKGLNPSETFIISATNKGLPFQGWKSLYKPFVLNPATNKMEGNFYVTNQSQSIYDAIQYVLTNMPHIKNFVLDDSNYTFQDHYMINGKKANGFNIFKDVAYIMAQIFAAADLIDGSSKHFIMIAHYETYIEDDITKYKFKTVGKAIDSNITPEGKFEIVLVADQTFNEKNKSVQKHFVTNYDGKIDVAKSPIGMFEDTHILNDMGLVLEKVENYENL